MGTLGAKKYTVDDTAKIHDMFNNGVPLHEIATRMGRTEYGIINKFTKEHANDPDAWDQNKLSKYRILFYEQNKKYYHRIGIGQLAKRMQKYVRDVGYQMASISRSDGYVRVEIEDDTSSTDSINTRKLKEDFRQHAKESLAYGQDNPRRSDLLRGDRRRFKGVPEQILVCMEDAGDDCVVILGFDQRGIDEATKKEMDNFLDVYCSLLKSEKKVGMKLIQKPISEYRSEIMRKNEDNSGIVSEWKKIFNQAVGSGTSKYAACASVAETFGVPLATVNYLLNPKYRASRLYPELQSYRKFVRKRRHRRTYDRNKRRFIKYTERYLKKIFETGSEFTIQDITDHLAQHTEGVLGSRMIESTLRKYIAQQRGPPYLKETAPSTYRGIMKKSTINTKYPQYVVDIIKRIM